MMRPFMDIDYNDCTWYSYLVDIGELMLAINSSVNFLVYILTTPSFRRKLTSLCFCGRCRDLNDISHVTMRGQPEGKASSDDDGQANAFTIDINDNNVQEYVNDVEYTTHF